MRLHRLRSWLLPSVLFFAGAEARAAVPFTDGGALSVARAQAAVAVDSTGTIHLMGGYTTGNTIESHELLFPDGGTGSAAPLLDPSRAAVAATGPDGVIYYVGGYSDNNGELDSLYAFGTDGGWSQLPSANIADASVPPGWETAGDFGADGKLYVFGGEGDDIDDAGATSSVNRRTLIYTPTTKTWTLGAPMPARRMQHRAARGSDGNIYVIGGEDENSQAQNTVFVYHPTTNTWTMGPPLVVADPDAGTDGGADSGTPVPINSFALAASPDRRILVVAGGSTEYGNGDSPYFDNVYIFDVASQTWSKYPTPLPTGRRELVAAFNSCSLHVLGGSTGGTVTEHDVAQLIGATTEVCNGFDDNCNGQVDEGALCTGATGSRCVTDTTTHCGCSTNADCGATERCNTTTQLCQASPGDEAGVGDGGVDSDGGSVGLDGGGTGGDNDSGIGDTGGGSSSGCSCGIVGGSSSDGVAALAGLGLAAALTARARRRSRRR